MALNILEIGGGEHPSDSSTVRVDIRDIPGKVDVVCNAISLPMFGDQIFDKVYARHVLEHWSMSEVPTVLKEWHRVLKPEGEIEIHCPDLDKLIQNYIHGSIDGYTGNRFDMNLFSYYVYGGQEYPENTHKSGWNYSSLAALLIKAKFCHINRAWNYEDNIEMRVKAVRC